MNRKPSLLIIFLTVFIDLVGFGIIIPLVPVYGRHLGANSLTLGLFIASFSAMQFIFSPILGRLSDRYGRKPILLISTAGAALSYALFAYGAGLTDPKASLIVLFLSRIFAGICGGNITVAQAYIADITPPENRSKRMGLIGMAFGLGFIFGPIIGGIALAGITLGGHWGIPALVFHGFGPSGPGWVAAVLCATNFFLALFVLVESLKPGGDQAPRRPRFSQWSHTLSQPKIGLLIIVFFFATFCFSCFESTLTLLVCDNFGLDIQTDERAAHSVIYLFAFCGIISAGVQGGMIGRLVKKHGEPKLIATSLVLTALSMAAFPFIKGSGPITWNVLFQPAGLPWWLMLGALAVLSVGSALTRPPLFGLLSNLTPANEQGATIGVAQGAGSLARILGPVFATTTLHLLPALPYLSSTVILLIIGVVAAQRLRA